MPEPVPASKLALTLGGGEPALLPTRFLKRPISEDTSSGTSSDSEEECLPSPKRMCSSGEQPPAPALDMESAFSSLFGDGLTDILSGALHTLAPTTLALDHHMASIPLEVMAQERNPAPSMPKSLSAVDRKEPATATVVKGVVGAAHNRKDWTAAEDAAIRSGVSELGMRWRAIAARLPGRSDDAVRNRWARLQDGGATGPTISTKATSPRQKREGVEQRHSWTAEEDAIIMSSIAEWGRRWNRIAERLPRRTEHAIRNRWHRLQMTALDGDASKGQQPAPATGSAAEEPAPPPLASLADLLDFDALLPTA